MAKIGSIQGSSVLPSTTGRTSTSSTNFETVLGGQETKGVKAAKSPRSEAETKAEFSRLIQEGKVRDAVKVVLGARNPFYNTAPTSLQNAMVKNVAGYVQSDPMLGGKKVKLG